MKKSISKFVNWKCIKMITSNQKTSKYLLIPVLFFISSFSKESPNSAWYSPGQIHQFSAMNSENPTEKITISLTYDQFGNASISKSTTIGSILQTSHIFSNWKSIQMDENNNLNFSYSIDSQFNWYILYFKTDLGLRVCSELGSGGSSGSEGDAKIVCDCDASASSEPNADCDVSAITSGQTISAQCIVKMGCMACKKPKLVKGNISVLGTGGNTDFLVFQAKSATVN